MIAPSAPYDQVADWYEHDFLVTQRALGVDGFADRLGIDRSLAELLGAGTGTCLEIGCGTGIYADRVRQLGRTPIGVDVSTGMLHRRPARLPRTVTGRSCRLGLDRIGVIMVRCNPWETSHEEADRCCCDGGAHPGQLRGRR